MKTNTKNLVSITEANQNFSKVAKKVDNYGDIIILKQNKPKYIISNLEKNPYLRLTVDEKIEIMAKRILKEHKRAFEVLGQ